MNANKIKAKYKTEKHFLRSFASTAEKYVYKIIISAVLNNGVAKKLLNPVSNDESNAKTQNRKNDDDMIVILIGL